MRRGRWSEYLRGQARLCLFLAGGLSSLDDVRLLESLAARYERVAARAERPGPTDGGWADRRHTIVAG